MGKTTYDIMEFPCTFPIKVMGVAENDFEETIINIIKKHASNLTKKPIKYKKSNRGKYISITITIKAKSKKQLDLIYLDLTKEDKVLMAL